MDAAHHDASHASSGSDPDPDPDLFSALRDLTSFVTNSPTVLTIEWELSPDQVSALSSLLLSGAEIESLSLRKELPASSGDELGSAIKRHGNIRALSLGHDNRKAVLAPELIRLAAASASAALEQLAISGLDLLETECRIKLSDSLGKSPALRSLTIQYCRFCTPFLDKRVNSFRALESVHVSWPPFLFLSDEELIATLLNLPVVYDLEICNMEVEAENRRKIGSLIASGRITKLRLDSNHLSDEGISAIVDAVRASGRQSCGLRELCLSNNDLGLAGAHAIVELAALSPHLRRLNLRRNIVSEVVLGAATKCAASLEELDLSSCTLGQLGAALLLVSPACPTLTELAVGGNELGNLGAEALARLLRLSGGFALKELHINHNDITEVGALALAHELANAYALRRISMQGNRIGPRGGVAILDALATASTVPMDTINFESCEIGGAAGAEAVGKLMRRRGCRRVRLGRNNLRYEGVRVITDSIQGSACAIDLLELYGNQSGDEGVTYLLDRVLLENKIVRELGVSVSDIGAKGAIAIKQATEVRGALKVISYGGEAKDEEAIGILHEASSIEHELKYKGAAMFVRLDAILNFYNTMISHS